PPTTDLYTLSLHDALPISVGGCLDGVRRGRASYLAGRLPGSLYDLRHALSHRRRYGEPHRPPESRASCSCSRRDLGPDPEVPSRSEEHTSELQSRGHLVCR